LDGGEDGQAAVLYNVKDTLAARRDIITQ